MSRIVVAALAALVCAGGAPAQTFPAKPVRFIVPFAPGGQSDVVARTVGQKASERLGQPVVVENKPGAATTIGADFVAKSPADGHTILLAPAPFVITQYAYPKLPYDSRRDFTPVTLLVTNPLVVTVNPGKVPAKSFQEFVAAAKKDPGKLNYGSPGNGSLPHLATELFRLRSGIDVVHVPYKGADALRDLLAGRIQFMFATIPSVKQHIDAGTLRAIAVSSVKRSRSMPDVPTVAERGFPGFEAGSWFGFFAPKGTPAEVVTTLNKAVNEIIAVPAFAAQMIREGADPAGGSPQDFGAFVQREFEKWRTVVRDSGAVVE
jgi:tripartite-type tricarboxylate transporter receptor subunit TctC